jgi:hypothetical protein
MPSKPRARASSHALRPFLERRRAAKIRRPAEAEVEGRVKMAFGLLGVVTFFLWAVLGHSTPAERQRTVDASCPPHQARVHCPEG